MKRDIIIALVVLAGTGLLYWSLSFFDDPRAATFPRVIILIMGGLSLALLIQTLLLRAGTAKAALQGTSVEEEKGKAKGTPYPWGKVIFTFVIVIVYFWVMEKLGFYFSGFLFIIGVTFILGRKDLDLKKGAFRAGVAFVFMAILYILFNKILLVQTPQGIFV